MPEVITLPERPLSGQVLVMSLLIALAWFPLIADIEPQISAYIGLLLALRVASLRWPALSPGRWFLLPLTIGGIVNVFAVYQTVVGQSAGTALLGTMLTLKLLEMHKLRDVRVATTLFGFLLVSQFLFDQSAMRALYLAALLILNIAVMVDLAARVCQGRSAAFSALRIALRLIVQALPLTLILFVLFPRLSVPLWNLNPSEEKARSGVKDWLEPGSVSELVLSGDLAFRVWFDGPVPADKQRYWRGPVVWQTDGRRWTGWPDDFPLGKASPPAEWGEEIGYRVALEASGENRLFALDLPRNVPADAWVLADFQVLTTKPVSETRSYRMVSALSYNTGELELEHEIAGTQLPENVTPRMRKLVEGWRVNMSGAEDIVHRALDFFNAELFHYTLLPPKLGTNPADEFLFETRRGFCEHYASSFALLMRIAGIPSRIVLGYLGGEYNGLGDYLIVRQSDAHAWVEVWLKGKGWVRVDPTASIAPERVERSALAEGLAAGAPLRFRLDDIGMLRRLAHNLGLLGDALGTGWREWVLGLSSARQQRMLERIGLGFLREYGLVLALVIGSALVLGLLLATLTRSSTGLDPLERIYAKFCKRLSRIGLPRRHCEGPRDYARRVIAARPDLRVDIESFVNVYLPLRYGNDPESDEMHRHLEHFLRAFRPQRSRNPRVFSHGN